MEAEYLRATVGEALAAGMAQTAMANPADPVEHLANWLTKYCDNIEDSKRQKNIYASHQAEEQAAIAKVDEDKRKAEVALSLQAAMEAELDNMNTICDTETTATALWKSVLEFLKVKTGATATYCGYQMDEATKSVVDGEEQEVSAKVIKYMSASSNNQFMSEKTLRMKGSGKKAKGQLTLGIFDEVEDIPAGPAEGEEGYGEEPVAPEGGWPMKWKTPCLVVDQCLQEPKMQYFRIPKLGSYMAVPFRFEYEEDAEAEGEPPAIVEGQCPPWPEFTTNTKTQLGVLAMDTLGTEREFRKDVEQPLASEWASKLAAGLARVSGADLATAREKREEYKQNNLSHWEDIKGARAKLAEELPGLLEASAAEWLAANTPEEAEAAAEEAAPAAEEAAAEEGDAAAEEAAAAEVASESELDKRLREGTVKLNATNAMMTELAEVVATVADRTDATCKQWKLLQSLCRFIQPIPVASDTWEECQVQCKDMVAKLVAPETAHRLNKARTCVMATTAQAVKAVLEEANVPELERTHAPISLLLDWGKAVIETSEAALAIRQAAKAVADEKGDEFTEQVEDNVTDKPAEAPPAEE